MTTGHSPGEGRPWTLPIAYKDMNRIEQAEVLEACILRFLDSKGRATAADIAKAIQAPKSDTVRKHLQRLAATQDVYMDRIGKEEVYFRNGTLAHHTLQSTIKARTTEYDVRVYKDPVTGRTLTITEYSVSPLLERTAKSGIRVDVADLDVMIEELTRVRDLIDQHPERLDPDLRR